MKITVQYTCASYGNDSSTAEYSVKLTRETKQVSINVEFAHPAPGRGVGQARGQVQGATLDLSRDAADALSRGLQLILANTASTAVEFAISEKVRGDERVRLVS